MIIYDDFLDSYQELKDYSLKCEYEDVVNPIDGVTYPLICRNIPALIGAEILEKITLIKGNSIKDYTMFMRQSPEGVHCPHPVHNDKSMGDWSFMLYLDDNPTGGTGLFRHRETGITYAPESEDYIGVLKRDQCDSDKWIEYHRFPMKQNRAAIFDAGLMHAALPFGGYGSGNKSRTVLTVFFK